MTHTNVSQQSVLKYDRETSSVQQIYQLPQPAVKQFEVRFYFSPNSQSIVSAGTMSVWGVPASPSQGRRDKCGPIVVQCSSCHQVSRDTATSGNTEQGLNINMYFLSSGCSAHVRCGVTWSASSYTAATLTENKYLVINSFRGAR